MIKTLSVGLLLAGLALALIFGPGIFAPKFLPPQIEKQLTFAPLLPKSGLLTRSVKYDPDLNLLTFVVRAGKRQIIVSEQPTPEIFRDVPQFYDKFLGGMSEYDKFNIRLGTVHLVGAKQLRQAAVLQAKNTLIMARPDSNFSAGDWQAFFETMTMTR